jgi:hypothetical protein
VAADGKFSFQKTRGALSDRGRVLLILGKPHRLNNTPAGALVDNVDFPGSDPNSRRSTTEEGTYSDRGATEIWEYEGDSLPVRVSQEYVYAVFRETRTGMQDYVLDRSDRRSVWVLKLLKEIPEALVVHPELWCPGSGYCRSPPPPATSSPTDASTSRRGAAGGHRGPARPTPPRGSTSGCQMAPQPALAVGRLRAASGREAGLRRGHDR